MDLPSGVVDCQYELVSLTMLDQINELQWLVVVFSPSDSELGNLRQSSHATSEAGYKLLYILSYKRTDP